MILKIKEKEYKVEFGYNAFCDTDLMDRVNDLANIFYSAGVKDDKDVNAMGQIKELFCVVRELFYVGCDEFESLQEVGKVLDVYKKEETEEEKHGLVQLFTMLSEELFAEGFLSDILSATQEVEKKTKKPTDHIKKVK